MILFNNIEIPIHTFPDNTQRLNLDVLDAKHALNQITWKYEGEFECMTLWYLVKHIKNYLPTRTLDLYLPYVPNARMDRVKHLDEVFTLKWFADFINSLGFTTVTVLDPHSNVTTALINRVFVENPIDHIEEILNMFKDFNPILYFPDAGAMKRYEGMLNEYPYLYGEKKRCWETGEILGLDLKGDVKRIEGIENPVFLMVDDICSYGGTFYYSAKALKEAFPTSKVYSWTTHTENKFPTLQKAFDEGLIESHFTTDSLYRSQNDKIKVLPC
jgi:ribose-phosphate pyrophosphokinase